MRWLLCTDTLDMDVRAEEGVANLGRLGLATVPDRSLLMVLDDGSTRQDAAEVDLQHQVSVGHSMVQHLGA